MRRCFILPAKKISTSWLKNHVHTNDLVLPLSLDGLAACQDRFEKVCSIEDLVPYSGIMELAVRAHDVNREFSGRSCEGLNLDGYDWPDISWHMQQWFFRDALLTQALSKVLERKGYDRIVWVGRLRREPVVYVPTFHAVATLMRLHFKGRFDLLPPPVEGAQVGPYLKKRLWLGTERIYKRLFCRKPSIIPSRVVAICAISEWDRYTDAFRDLRRTFGEKFQLWILGARYPEQLRQWAKREGLPLTAIPYPDRVDERIHDFFSERWIHWLRTGRKLFSEKVNCPTFGSDEIQYHFGFFFMKIWPSLAQWARTIEDCLGRAKPAWVIGSSNYPPEWAFPHYVARKLGISSIALPHSYVQYGDGQVAASFLACRNQMERTSFQRSFSSDQRILYCHNAGNTLSYEVRPTRREDVSGKKIIAFLTAHPDYDGSMMPTADRRVFLGFLQSLSAVPSDLEQFSFAIKSHPRGDVTPLLRNGEGLHPSVIVIDPSSSVIDLIEKSWIIVLGNHYGSVAVQAIMSRKPLLFLDSARSFWPYTEKVAFPAGEVVEDMDHLWNLIRRLKDSPVFYLELSDRCRRFKETYLQPVMSTLAQNICSLESRQNSRV